MSAAKRRRTADADADADAAAGAAAAGAAAGEAGTDRIPFVGGRTLADFRPETVLRFEGGGRFVVVQGTLAAATATAAGPATDNDASRPSSSSSASARPLLLQLEQRAACADAEAFVAALPRFSLTLTNDSGAEYSFYRARGLGGAAEFDVECIWPASARQIARKTPSRGLLVEETAALYTRVVDAFAAAQAAKIGWLEAVVTRRKERERNLFHNARFVVNVDTKWTTHAPLSADPAKRAAWRGAPWTDGLYLLAISSDPSLRSLRDLRGEAGARLCDEMREALRNAARDVYGVPASQLRIFFHYHPQFYRLHAHCTRLAVNPGCECERAHLLTTVAAHCRAAPHGDYYARATLTYKVREGEKLHRLLVEAGDGLLSDE